MSTWEQALWSELDAMSGVDQVVATAEWISMITHSILPELGRRRRQQILYTLARPDWDAQRLAETIGSRPTTVRRLADEARRELRDHVVEEPPLPVN